MKAPVKLGDIQVVTAVLNRKGDYGPWPKDALTHYTIYHKLTKLGEVWKSTRPHVHPWCARSNQSNASWHSIVSKDEAINIIADDWGMKQVVVDEEHAVEPKGQKMRTMTKVKPTLSTLVAIHKKDLKVTPMPKTATFPMGALSYYRVCHKDKILGTVWKVVPKPGVAQTWAARSQRADNSWHALATKEEAVKRITDDWSMQLTSIPKPKAPKMRTMTQAEFNKLPVSHGVRQCPGNTDYSQIMCFGQASCSFGPRCKFGDISKFEDCTFGDHSKFGKSCLFLLGCDFGSHSSFADLCEFDADCSFGDCCTFGNCDFAPGAVFGDRCKFEGKGIAKSGNPLIIFDRIGPSRAVRYCGMTLKFYNLKTGVWVRFEAQLMAITEFRFYVHKQYTNKAGILDNHGMIQLGLANVAEVYFQNIQKE